MCASLLLLSPFEALVFNTNIICLLCPLAWPYGRSAITCCHSSLILPTCWYNLCFRGTLIVRWMVLTWQWTDGHRSASCYQVPCCGRKLCCWWQLVSSVAGPNFCLVLPCHAKTACSYRKNLVITKLLTSSQLQCYCSRSWVPDSFAYLTSSFIGHRTGSRVSIDPGYLMVPYTLGKPRMTIPLIQICSWTSCCFPARINLGQHKKPHLEPWRRHLQMQASSWNILDRVLNAKLLSPFLFLHDLLFFRACLVCKPRSFTNSERWRSAAALITSVFISLQSSKITTTMSWRHRTTSASQNTLRYLRHCFISLGTTNTTKSTNN